MNQAGRVTDDFVAVPQLAWRGLPSGGDPRLQQFIRARTVIPDGDRRDLTESGRSEDQNESFAEGCNHIVRVFILRDRLRQQQGRRLRPPPHDRLLQRAEA